ncbi:hypothetical protein K493DRAFT_310925 [Basidiobolus meristosporus CBS 931.73]|uniref:Uncharacterized protein n=1 Tax=Basidiobolus meristosporus CBS 931.73 TaxID=1314790 RepID=A0A1Y1Z5H9_9FUNG|nr:hypothetical protein K493DRAFT_310925 [Basidiobolus meristosporus CBS 931.73]|eukprot:ORY05513.1 hypothetical protein K493DRAFT_310925 [Basidiobolus meristosporus CBS 931.73]
MRTRTFSASIEDIITKLDSSNVCDKSPLDLLEARIQHQLAKLASQELNNVPTVSQEAIKDVKTY